MSTTADFAAIGKKKKFKVREYNRCLVCGRSRAYLRTFAMCRMCFRKRSLAGEVPGVVKASW
ncbi:MAG: type Z 30S ribosomal protein S14 [Deltaproteobacteria bacterium]|nr:type Z 30S ribosomal protein S14 [Deltaproteobacteria bacterium]